ncbi:serine/threonine-protein kinase [Iningainema tapete]|uniref:non-specific serine/threonine protein kinase n=1 Tax=Iningainema tapete BLCC-T55 TaxID=2748662 RepID=A0A8J7C4J1_9CYAN|nr:serine/threonine-protein kinase [Iningainema tapete]MBD2771569.1 serine/threonine protein kinase [Iningainema tapete BLCC-T55]
MMTPTLLNNRYQVIRVLGSGGFGETFLAEDTQMPSGRRCVIKQLKPVADNPLVHQLVQERFQREAAILEELGDGSNQIPRLYAYFVENGQFYLVQEYIEGQTLTQKLQQPGKLSESSVKEILINILPVLDYVHSKRIVHRDIKPDNILIRYADRKPVLIDFGAVKETMGTVVTASGNSSQSIVIGTPGFMPSEQTAGRPLYSSDLYSLGLTAIYLLTGKIPQELACDPATGEILWRQYALNVTPSFAAVLDKAIQSHARDRFSSAEEMRQALRTGAIAPTILSAQEASSQTKTVLSSYPSKPIPNSDSLTDLQKILILGVFISVSVVIGFFLTRSPQMVVSESKNTQQPSSTQPSASPLPVPVATPTQLPVTPPNQTRSVGWIRIGAVNKTVGTALPGEQLIKTIQPVTIDPRVVPRIGNKVTVINGVNLRISQPQKPSYQLADSIGVAVPGQEMVILKLDSFADPTSPFPYIVVWAEVGLLN